MEDEAVASNDATRPPNATAADWSVQLTDDGPADLSGSEAATLLGASIETVRRLIQAGRLHTFHHGNGKVHISASVTYTPENADGNVEEGPESASTALLWTELKATRKELAAARAEESRLQAELEAAEAALEYTKAEVANLWRVMTSRNFKEATRKAGEVAHSPKIITLSEQRTRIRSKVADVRMLARRRKWPWSMVG